MSHSEPNFDDIVNARHHVLDTPMAGYLLYGTAALLLAAQVADRATSLEPLMGLAPVLGAGYMYLYHRNHKVLQTKEQEYVKATAPQHAQHVENLTLKQKRQTRTYGALLAVGLGLAVGAATVAHACDLSSVDQAAIGAAVFGGVWVAAHRSRKAITETVWERLHAVNEIKNEPQTKSVNQWLAKRRGVSEGELSSIPTEDPSTVALNAPHTTTKSVSI